MGLERYYARASSDPVLTTEIASELRARWDPAGAFVAPDGECTAESHARAILGLLGPGGHTAAVKGYFRRAEEQALGNPRTTSLERGALAEDIWRKLVDVAIRAAHADGIYG